MNELSYRDKVVIDRVNKLLNKGLVTDKRVISYSYVYSDMLFRDEIVKIRKNIFRRYYI